MTRFPATVITMLDERMNPVFEVIVYGVHAKQLLTIPNEIIRSIARKYPGYFSSPFHVRPLVRRF